MDINDAIDATIKYCIENGILADFLTNNEKEVKDILLAQYYVEIIEQNREQVIEVLFNKGYSAKEISEISGLDEEEILKQLKIDN